MEADIQQYPAHETRGPLLLGSAYGLHAITIIVFLIRLYSRLTPRFALTAADYTITIAVVRFASIRFNSVENLRHFTSSLASTRKSWGRPRRVLVCFTFFPRVFYALCSAGFSAVCTKTKPNSLASSLVPLVPKQN